MFHLLALSFYIMAELISQAQSIEDQVPEESSIATYLTKLPSVWFNVWKFLDQQQPVTSSQKSSKVKPASKKQLTFRRRRLPRKRPRPGPLRNEAEEKQFFIAPPPPPVPGRFPIFFRRRPLSIFTRLALGAQVFYGNLAFLGGWWHCPCKIVESFCKFTSLLCTGVGAGAAWLLSRRPTFDQEGNYGGLNTTITSSRFFFSHISY